MNSLKLKADCQRSLNGNLVDLKQLTVVWSATCKMDKNDFITNVIKFSGERTPISLPQSMEKFDMQSK